MITRTLAPVLVSAKKSILLLGPRQTGKSTLVASLEPDMTINLAQEAVYLNFLQDPALLEQRLRPFQQKAMKVFIDEVQRLPSLLNTIQAILDSPANRVKFYLTGSSARKLKRGHANLLPGRILTYALGPLSCGELGFNLDVRQALAYGTLPGIWTEEDVRTKEKVLRSYAATYLKEEIQAEGLARNLEGFARFLQAATVQAGHFLDLAKLAFASQVARQSALRFFEVLEDSLVVKRMESFAKSAARRLVQHPKYYFFDVGVLNGLLGNFTVSQDRIGMLFEHLVCNQIMNEAAARDRDIRLCTFRTGNGAEVDVIVETGQEVYAIEIKASKLISAGDLWGLKAFREYYGEKHRSWVLFLGEDRREINGVEIWPWQKAIAEMFDQN